MLVFDCVMQYVQCNGHNVNVSPAISSYICHILYGCIQVQNMQMFLISQVPSVLHKLGLDLGTAKGASARCSCIIELTGTMRWGFFPVDGDQLSGVLVFFKKKRCMIAHDLQE